MPRFLCLVSLIFVLSACGKLQDLLHHNSSNGGSAATPLEGTWSGPHPQQGTLTFTGNTLVAVSTESISQGTASSSGGQTTVNSAGWTMTFRTSFQLPGPAATPAGAQKVNLLMQSTTFTPLDQAAANEMNQNSTCGLTTWQVGQGQDISGKSCDENGGAGKTIYTIYQISGSNLNFGSPGAHGSATDGSSDANRPTQLSTTALNTYTKP